MSDRTGQCLCGAVRFTARDVPATFGACHCEMCRRWTGSALLGVTLTEAQVTWEGAENIARFQSSPWAERAWCRTCGSNLYYRVTLDGPHAGKIELSLGLFDAPDGFTMENEIFIDVKPDSYAFAGTATRRTMTRQDCFEKWGVPQPEGDPA